MSLRGPRCEITRMGRLWAALTLRFENAGCPVGHWSLVFGELIVRNVAVVSWVAVRLNTAAAAPVEGTEEVPASPTSRHALPGRGLLVAPAHAVCVLARVSHMRKGTMPWNSPGTIPEPVGAEKYP